MSTTTEFRSFMKISKIDKERRMVWGYASTPSRDLDGEIIELQAIKEALPDYMAWANIREMHQPSAVGVAKEATVDEKGLWIGALVKDDIAWSKCQLPDPVYKGFSIGGIVTKQEGSTIKGLQLVEISLVDRPANPDCRIEIVKNAKIVEDSEAHLLPATDLVASAELTEAETDAIGKSFFRQFLYFVKGGSPITPAAKEPVGEVSHSNTHESQTIEEGAFADPGLQSDGQKRYPVDTEEHIRAAWSYINMPKNSEHYEDGHLQTVRDNIIRAWKDKIDPDGPPGAAEKVAALHKGVEALVQVSYAFESLRRAQRYLLLESALEHDPVDADRSQRAAVLASQLASLMADIARDEGGEALTMTDIEDLNFASYNFPQEIFMAATDTNINKRASSMRTHLSKAVGHMQKAAMCKATADEHCNALHQLCKGFAMKSAEALVAKAAPPAFDHDAAVTHCIAMKSAMSQMDDHAEMAAHHMEKAAGDLGPTDNWDPQGSVKPAGNTTEGDVPGYDPTKPYPGKSATVKMYTEAELATLTENAVLKAKVEMLERQPVGVAGQRAKNFDLGSLGAGLGSGAAAEDDARRKLLDGVVVGSEDPEVRRKSTGRMITNMIMNGMGKNPMLDPNFRGQAG